MARSSRSRGGRSSGRRKKSATRTVDFTNVGNTFKPDERYYVEVAEVTIDEGQKGDYYTVVLEGVEDMAGAKLWHIMSLSEAALFKLKEFLLAIGEDVPSGPLELVPEDWIGKGLLVDTYLDRGGDQPRVKVSQCLAEDEAEEEEDEKEKEEEPKASRRSRRAKAEEDEEDEDERPRGRSSRSSRRSRKEEPEAEEEEEEEETPRARRRGKKGGKSSRSKKPKEGYTEDEIGEMTEEDLHEVIDQLELDVDLSKCRTLRSMRNKVIDTMEEEGLIE